MNKIKKTIFIFLFAIFFLQGKTLAITNSIIGTIDNKPLTSVDLVNEMKMLLIINGQTFTEEKRPEIQSAAINSITNRLIKEIEIEKYNFNEFNSVDREKKINDIANRLGKNKKELMNAFEANQVNFSHLINNIETELKWNGLIFFLYKNRINVNLNEINDQLEVLKNQEFINEYLVYEILIDRVEKEKLEEKVNLIKNKIETNGFEITANEFSKSPSSTKGGRLGWLKETMLSEDLKEVVRNTKINSITEPLFTPEGILILKIANKREIDNSINLEEEKQKLVNEEKQKKLIMYSVSHYNKVRESITINYNLK